MADQGAIWLAGLSRFGDSIGQGISQSMQIYQQRQQQLQQSDALMHELANTIDPVTGKPVLDKGAYEDFLNHSSRQRVALAGAKMGALQMIQHMQKAGLDARETMAKTNLYQIQGASVAAGGTTKGAGNSAVAGKVAVPDPTDPTKTIYVTGNEAVRMQKDDVLNQWKALTGFGEKELTDSSLHAAVRPIVEGRNITGYVKDPSGTFINVGGQDAPVSGSNDTTRVGGYTLPADQLGVFQRRIKMKAEDLKASTPAAAGGKVMVRNPQGQVGMIPADRLQAYLAQPGWTQVQ